jgi:hypothetical protein
MHDLTRKHAGGLALVRAALPTHGLETGAVALGVLNYASKTTEINADQEMSTQWRLK